MRSSTRGTALRTGADKITTTPIDPDFGAGVYFIGVFRPMVMPYICFQSLLNHSLMMKEGYEDLLNPGSYLNTFKPNYWPLKSLHTH